MELGAEINIKVKKTIKKQLQTLGCYVDDELPEYIMVMIANKRTKEQMIDDLNLFLSDEAEKFVSWLFIVLGRIQKAVEVPDIDTLLEKENGEIDNKGKSKKKSKSDDESSRNSKIKERNKRKFKEKKSNLSDEDKEYLERKKRREKEAKEREEKRKKEAEREEEKAREIKRRREERRKRDEEERKKASDQRRGRSHDRQRSRSRSRSRSKNRHRSRSRSRGHRVRSRSHSRGRRRHSRSHSRDRRSHSRSHSRGRRGRSRSRSRVRSRSHSRRRSRSRSRDEKRETRKVSLSHEKRNDSSENRNLEEVEKIQENDKIRAEAEAEAKRIENRNESAKNPMEFVKLIASDINKKLFQHQNDVKPKEVVAEKIEFAVPTLKDVPTTDTNDITNKANISLQAVSQYGEGEIENEKVEKKTSENRKEMKRQHSRSKSRSRSRSRDQRNSRRSRSRSTSKDRNHNRRRRKSHSRERKNATNDKKDRTVARRDRSRSREREPRKRCSRSRDRRNSGKVDHHERSRKDGDTAKANAMDNENDRKEIEGKDLRNVIRGSSQEDGKTKSLSSQVKVHTNFKRPAVSKNREVSSALLKRAVTDVVKEQPKQEQFVEEDEVELDYTENIDEALHQTAKNTDQNDDRRIISFGSPNTDLPTITLVNYNSDNKPSPERVNTSNNKQYNNKKPRHDNRVKTRKDGRAENVYSEEEIELRKGLLQDMSKVDARYAILKSRLENETSRHKREKEKEASKPKYMGSMIADLEENSNRQKRLKLKQQKSRERKREYEERLVAQQVRREEGLLKRRHSAAVEEELKKRNRSDILKKETERIKRQELLRSGEIEDKSDLRNLLRGRKDKESSDDEDTLANKLREKIKEEKHKRLFGKINSDEKRKLKKERDILREKLKRKRYMKKKAEYMLRKAESRRKEKLEVSLKKDKSDEKIDESEQNGASDKDEWVERSNDNGNESEADENEAQQDRETEEDEEKEEENETGSTHEEEENMEQGNSEEENNEENEKEESDNEENVSEGNEEENPNEQENSSASTEEREEHENETVVEEEANADEEVNEAGEGDEKEKSDNEKVESENEDEAQEQDLPPEQEENVTETLTEDHKPNENSENTVKEKHKKSKKKRRHTRHEFIVTLDGLSGGGKSLSIKTGTHSSSRRHTRRHSAEEHYAVRHTESRWTRDKSSSFTQSDEEFEQIMRKKEAEQQEQRQLRKSRRRHSGGHQHRKRSRDLLDNKEDEEELNEVDREILLAENKLKAQQLLRKSLEQVQNVNVSLDLHENSKSKTAFINPHFQAPFLKKPIGLNDQGTVLTQLGGRGDSLTSLSYSTSLVEVGVAQADKVRAQADKVINEKDVSEQQDISTGDNDSKNVQKIENESAPVEVQSVEQRTSVETSETSSPTTTATKALTTSNVVRTLQERCVYWPDCKNPTCNYVHPTASCKSFPNCSYGARCLYIHPPCKYSERCTNADCPFTHKLSKTTPPPFTSTPMCKFLPNCTKKDCTFLHPILKPCRFGSSCKKPDCLFLHENRSLPGSKSDSKHKWVAEKSHISERKFAVHEAIVVENPINVVVTTKE